MPGADPSDHLPLDDTVKADVVAWVSKLDAAVNDLYRAVDLLPGIINAGGSHGADRRPSGVRRSPK